MKKYKVEYSFAENFTEAIWYSFEDYFEAENAEEAAKKAAHTDGFEEALFRVSEIIRYRGVGRQEPSDKREFFHFGEF